MSARTSLREKEAKLILANFRSRFQFDEEAFSSKPRVEKIGVRDGELIFIDGQPLVLQKLGKLIPTLKFDKATQTLPKVVVDMGAVPYVCNGADIMAKGIKRIEGTFEKGRTVMVVDEKHGKHLAIGEALEDSGSIPAMSKGKAIANLHFVSDDAWEAMKTSSQSS
jgi:PUA domain protein